MSADDVRDILDDKLRETGLDKVPKRLDLLDKILTSIDKLVGEIKGYREEQAFNSGALIEHKACIEKLEKRASILP